MVRKKIMACVLCMNAVLLTACSASTQPVGDGLKEDVKEEEQKQVEDVENTLYKREGSKVYKYSVVNGIVEKEDASKQEISKLQLDKLIDGRILVWQDCFEGNVIKEDVWKYEEGKGLRNGELQTYVKGSDNVELENGALKITAKNKSSELDNDKWTSASIQTKGTKQFCTGRIEARIRYSNRTGQWGAFWTVGQWIDNSWPRTGEIDICEQYGDETSDYFKATTTLHYANEWGDPAQTVIYEAHSYDNRLTDKLYHIYAIEWTSDSITTYIDNNEIATFDIDSPIYWKQFEQSNGRCNPFQLPHYLKLNLAVNPNNPPVSSEPMTMEIDWVRVYAGEAVTDVQQVIPDKLGIDYVCNVQNASKIAFSDMEWNGNVGDEIYLGAVYLPETVVDRTCQFSVDNEEIAEIDSNTGTLTVKSEGTVIVTVKDMTTGLTASRGINISIADE